MKIKNIEKYLDEEYYPQKQKIKRKKPRKKDLDIEELIGCAIWYKTSYWFSSQECINLHTIYIKKNFRNFKLVNTIINSIKKVAKNLPIYLTVTTGNDTEPVFKKLGFEKLGSNWRYN